jgi:DNA-directed RNA polymerase specialized sigma24 family protein
MAVRVGRTAGGQRNGPRGSIATAVAPGSGPGLTSERVGEVLGNWQRPELRIARGFGECRGLTAQELEDIYQDTVEVLLQRRYASEEHLRNALRSGLKHRALHFHRDEGRRGEILAESAPTFHVPEQAGYNSTERTALIREDRLVVTEFLTELSPLEQRVFWLLAEGMKYRLIAKVLSMEVNAARNATRACEKKREHFQLLYDTGRLCGYRAGTIQALQAGESTSHELANRAFAHLESCASCRAEHRTNARRLRHRFQDQAAILLPMPVFMARLGWLVRLDARARTLQHRFAPDGLPLGPGGARERAVALLVGAGAASKLAVGVATVAVIAGSTIGATHVLDHKPAPHRHHAASRATATPIAAQPVTAPPALRAAAQPRGSAVPARKEQARTRAHRRASSRSAARTSSPGAQREPGGFAYLGVPTESSSTSAPAPARSASQSSGGLFSP